MIVYTKIGQKTELPFLFAIEGGVFAFNFFGDTAYVDPYDSTVWYWEGVTNNVDEVLGVTQGIIEFIITTSLNDCIATEGSFFWDDTNGILYVHYLNSSGDWAVDRNTVSYAKIIAGFANGHNPFTGNIFDGVLYETRINDISGLTKSADPTKLGLVSISDASMTLSDEENSYYKLNSENAVGTPIWIYYIEETETQLTDTNRIFTGFLNGYSHNRDTITYKIIEQRFYQDKPACPNVILESEYPNAGNNAGKIIPTAWGDIRRGKMILTNAGSLTDGASGTAIFLVADPSITSVRAISKVYNKDDIEVTINTSNLTACTVEVTKPANVSVNELAKWKWQGEGYDIDGDYNNGLDIIRANFLYLSNLPYLSSTFDVDNWNLETINNSQPVGISIQSDKGFVEEVIEPISTSLQGTVYILGNGRVSWAARNIFASVSETIEAYDQLDIPAASEDPKSLVSEIVINYSPDFVDKDLGLSYTYSGQKGDVIRKYGIDKRDPLSPVKTVLVNNTDAETIALELMQTSANPERIIDVPIKYLLNSKVFEIIKIDTGTWNNINYEYGELLQLAYGLNNKTQEIKLRIIKDYQEGD